MNPTILAIDPGASGGIAILHNGKSECQSMPETPKDLCDILRAAQGDALIEGGTIRCYMEEVNGFAGEEQPGSRMFNFGRGVGQIEGMLLALEIPVTAVRPQKWINASSLGTRGTVRGDYKGMTREQAELERKRISQLNRAAKTAWKNKLKEKAQQLFPHLKITLKTADACLLLEYARRIEINPTSFSPPPKTPVSTSEPVIGSR